MKIAKAIVIGVLLALAPVASAVDVQFVPGDYTDDQPFFFPGNEITPKFQVRQQGSKIRFIDIEKQITYGLDLKNPGEQFLPRKFVDAMRANKRLGRAGDILEKASVSGIRAGKTPNEFAAEFNLYLLLKSPLGEARMTVQFEARAEATKGEGYRFDGQSQTSFETNEIKTELGSAKVTTFKSFLPDSANTFIASVLSDLVEKLSSMDHPKATLYEIK